LEANNGVEFLDYGFKVFHSHVGPCEHYAVAKPCAWLSARICTHFYFKYFDICHNSNKQSENNELFIVFEKQ
jgi:hypothetical protein